jgi:hypothetical protein
MATPPAVDPVRRRFLARLAAAIAAAAAGTVAARPPAASAQARPPVGQRPADAQAAIPRDLTVYKDPTCGCCTRWAQHVRQAGFLVTERETTDLDAVKAAMGVPAALASCHTARIGRYVIEGHVPADLIARLLRERPDARGLAVPGMPVGSPGMEGGRPERYDVLLIDRAGRPRVYATRN